MRIRYNRHLTHHKIVSQRSLELSVKRLRKKRRRVVFTNGCFDIIHVGHVALLEQARALGDTLIVALNSDRSVRGLKGAGRPVVAQKNRARVLAALSCVDYVTVFNSPTPLELIKRLKPNVLVKGSNWKGKEIVGRDVVISNGGKIVRVPVLKGHSSTHLVSRLHSSTH